MTLDEAVAKLVGTSDHGIEYAEELGLQLDDLEAEMANRGYERCVDCDTWVEVSELDENDVCESCQ